MRVFFFSPSNVCFCREKEEKKKITRFLYIFPVPIKIDLSSMAAAQQRQFLIFFSLSSREGGLFWQDQIWQTSRKRGRPSRFTSYSSSSKKLIFPPSGVFFFFWLWMLLLDRGDSVRPWDYTGEAVTAFWLRFRVPTLPTA